MFNFLKDASTVSVDPAAGFDRNVSIPRWTFVFDSETWLFVVPDKA
ncbi:MAG: hypothetical protein ACC742_08420 [Thermoanaerobaculales bacterium]